MKRLSLLFFILVCLIGAEEAHIFLNGASLGQAPIEKKEERSLTLDEKFLAEPLQTALNENGRRIMTEILKKKITIYYDHQNLERSILFRAVQDPLEVHLIVPPQLLEGRGLKNQHIAYEEEIYQYPAKRSFYINGMAGYKMIHNYFSVQNNINKKNAEIAKKNDEIAIKNRQAIESDPSAIPEPLLNPYVVPPQHETYANFDVVANVNQFVAQGYIYYVASAHQGLSPGNVLLSRDFEKRQIRVAAGNINYMTLGFQNSIPLFGINVSKNQQLFTNPVIGPLSRNEFFLNVPTKIDVYIDNVYSNTIEAPAGPFLVSSFPIIHGLNNVRLKITGAAGEQITLDLNTFFLAELLKKNEDNYAFTLGIPTYNFTDRVTAYQWKLPTLSLMYRRGFGDTFTAGLYAQGQLHQGYFGGQFVKAIGDVKGMLDVAFSQYSDYPFSFRSRLQLSPYVKTGEKPPTYNWKIVADGMTRYFGYLGGKPAVQPQIFTVGGNIGRDLPNNAKINLIANFGVARATAKTPRLGTVTTEVQFQQALYKDLVAKVNASIKTANSKPVAGLLFALDYTPKDGKSKGTASYNTQQQLALLSLSQTLSFAGDRSVTISAGASKGPDAWNATGAVNYQGAFAELLASHYLAKTSLIDPDTTLGVSFFNVGSALVEADGYFAISRPVSDSFIIVVPDRPDDNLFLVNPGPDGDYLAQSNRFGRVVLSKVPSYKPFDVQARHPKTGTLKQRYRTVYPRYKSGTVVHIGRQEVYVIKGRVVGGGKPVAAQGAVLVRADENPPRVWSFEIDANGYFSVDDIPAGDYILILDHYDLQEAQVHFDPTEMKPASDGTFDFGSIEMDFAPNS